MDQIQTVIVGYGYAGRLFHANLIRLAQGLHLYGVCSGREEIRQELHSQGLKTYACLDDILSDGNVDLVVLATPNDTHAPYAIQAMEAGKHVVVDKPMCLTIREADAMIETSRRTGRLLSVFHNRRWDGDFLTIQQLVAEGKLGELLYAEAAWHQCKPLRTWRNERQRGGGKFIDLASHLIDQALLLVPYPIESVFARFQYGAWENDVEDHAHCILTFSNGTDFHIETSSISRCPKPRWYLMGTRGTLRKEGLDPQENALNAGNLDAAVEPYENRIRLWTGSGDNIHEESCQPIPGRWRSYYENIVGVLNGRAELAVTPQSIRRTVAVLEAAFSSVEQGVPVKPEL